MLSRVRTTCRVAALALATGVMAQATFGQGIPEGVITATSISADGAAAIKSTIDTSKGGLTGDASTLKRSRSTLAGPLRTPGVSIAFRDAYTAQLIPVLRPLFTDKRDDVAINAIVLASELGTKPAVDLLTSALKDPRQSIRVRAGMGFARTFVTIREGTPALLSGQADAALVTLGDALGTETDPAVLDAIGTGLESAVKVPDTRMEGFRVKALSALVKGVSGAVRKAAAAQPTPIDVSALELRATKVLFDALSLQQTPLPADLLVETGGLAGDVLASVNKRVQNGNLTEAQRNTLSIIATQSERVVIACTQKLDKPAAAEMKLGETLAKGEDDKFRADAAKIIGAEGVLTRPPFGLSTERFSQ